MDIWTTILAAHLLITYKRYNISRTSQRAALAKNLVKENCEGVSQLKTTTLKEPLNKITWTIIYKTLKDL